LITAENFHDFFFIKKDEIVSSTSSMAVTIFINFKGKYQAPIKC
jgi:hypothetical protein